MSVELSGSGQHEHGLHRHYQNYLSAPGLCFLRACPPACFHVHVHIHVHILVHIHVHIHVFVCVSVYLHLLTQSINSLSFLTS